MKRGRKPKKLGKRQKEILSDIVENYLYWKETKERLRELFREARKRKIPITQLAKVLGIDKVAVSRRYKRSGKKLKNKKLCQ